MKFENKLLNDYAKLIVKVGVNPKKNQLVYINSIIEAAPLTRLVVDWCYKAGAKKVIVKWTDEYITHANLTNQSIETLTDIKQYDIDSMSNPILKEGGCRIRIGGESPEAYKDIDPKKLHALTTANGKYLKALREFTASSKCQWTIADFPTKTWAKVVFPKLNEEEAIKKLWYAILKTVRVDGKHDPVVLWKKHNDQTNGWANKLNKFNFDYLHFENKLGTNLNIKLVKNHIWEAGEFRNSKLTPNFTANLPTEEVWTMPHKDGLDGIVVASKPLSYQGKIINNFKFEFKKGKVVKYSAKIGHDILKQIFSVKNADRTGEIALVPKTSPINQSGVLFYSTLYDENASCHIALGACYPSNIKGGVNMSKKELEKNGANDSLVHIDFMFGTDDLNVWGYKNNKKIQIIKNGLFTI